MPISTSRNSFHPSKSPSSKGLVKTHNPPSTGSEKQGNDSSHKAQLVIDTDVATKKASRRHRWNLFRRAASKVTSPARAVKPSLPLDKDLPLHPTNTSGSRSNKLNGPAPSSVLPTFSAGGLNSNDALELLKDVNHASLDSSVGQVKPRPSRASLFSWKRMSQHSAPLVVPQEKFLDTDLHDQLGSPEDTIQTSASSDDAPSSIMSSEISDTMCSSGLDTNETSVNGSVEEHMGNECGMAGIGVRNRNSISLHSLPIKHSYHHPASGGYLSPARVATANKLPYHPGMKYAPSNSSPLSSRSHSPSEIASTHTHHTVPSRLNPMGASSSRASTSTSSIINRSSPPPPVSPSHRLSFGRLNIVPNQNYIASEQLMRILRGPSSYPEETLPRSNDGNSTYLCV